MAVSHDLSPLLKHGVKLESLPLTPVEGFVVSRITGMTPVREIIAQTGLPAAQVEAALAKLEKLGVIEYQKVEAAGPRAKSASAPKGEVKPSGTDISLTLERIALMYRSLERTDYYKLLGIPRSADDGTIKAAYAAMSREIHPDRFFNVNLGDKKDMLDTVFAKMSIAYETLRDPVRRASYDRSLIPASMRTAQDEDKGAGQAPKRSILADTSKIVALAEQELRAGNYPTAIQNFKIAAAMDPGNKELADRAAFIEGLQTLMNNLTKLNNDPEGARLLEDKVVNPLINRIRKDRNLFPVDERLLTTTITFLLNFDRDASLAREFAEKLIKRAPRANFYVLLGRVCERENKREEAQKQYEKALSLDGNSFEAKEALRVLRKK